MITTVKNKYRVGRSSGRAILEVETGHEHLVFPVGSEQACSDYCDFLNKKEALLVHNSNHHKFSIFAFVITFIMHSVVIWYLIATT